QDDPQLNVRHWHGRDPLRIILDMELSLSRKLKVFSDDKPLVIVNKDKEGAEGHHLYRKAKGGDELIPELLRIIRETGAQSVIIEGGAKTLKQFLASGLWDEARVIHGSKVFGQGIPAPMITLPPTRTFDSGDDQVSIYYNTANPLHVGYADLNE
ncbi:MAG: dihydrofolate reductase family protein, partial [Bacteroidales bacterium]|nr:dihydrofolate reductase family protein [Bacteroidales bacterium]